MFSIDFYDKLEEVVVDNYLDQFENEDYSFLMTYNFERQVKDGVAESWQYRIKDYIHLLDKDYNLHLTPEDFIKPNMTADQEIRAIQFCQEYFKDLQDLTIPAHEELNYQGRIGLYGHLETIYFDNPDIIQKICTACFKNTYNLIKFTIPRGVKVIDEFAFTDSRMEEINFEPNSQLQVICMGAFSSCAMYKIDIPDKVEIIDDGAFYKCKNLNTVNIPDSVKEIGDRAFDKCSPNLIIHTTNPIAIDYCKKNNIKYVED